MEELDLSPMKVLSDAIANLDDHKSKESAVNHVFIHLVGTKGLIELEMLSEDGFKQLVADILEYLRTNKLIYRGEDISQEVIRRLES